MRGELLAASYRLLDLAVKIERATSEKEENELCDQRDRMLSLMRKADKYIQTNRKDITMTGKYTIEPYPHSRTLPRADAAEFDAAIAYSENGGVRCLLLCSSRRAPFIKRALEALDAGEGPLPFTQDKEAWEALRQGIQELKQGATEEISEAVQGVKEQVARPSVLYRAQLTKVSRGWMARYHAVTGYGLTPDAAMKAFDVAWHSTGGSRMNDSDF